MKASALDSVVESYKPSAMESDLIQVRPRVAPTDEDEDTDIEKAAD